MSRADGAVSVDPVGVDDVPVPPAFLWRPPRVRSLLPRVVKVCASVGRLHEPEQALAVDVLTGLRADGAPASLVGAVISARQNLKTYVMENVVLTRMVDPADPADLFFWTSQQIDTCEETFLHFLGIFDNADHPHMRRRFRRAITTNGKQMIELASGKRLKFKARSEKSGQGFAGDVVVFDEGFAVEDEHVGAMVPTLSTRRRAMVLYGSSAGHAGSGVLRGVRDQGRRGGRGAPAYIEWCAPGSFDDPGCDVPGCGHTPGSPGCALDREDLVQQANPMAGRRITWEYLREERRSFPPLKYARERLGWWDDPLGAGVVRMTPAGWAGCAVPVGAYEVGAPVFGVAVSWDSAWSALAVAGLCPDGVPQVEVVRYGRGVAWLPGAVADHAGRWPGAVFGLVPSTPAGVLGEELERAAPGRVVTVAAGEYAQACGGLANAAASSPAGVRHLGDEVLSGAVAAAATRPRGDGGWVWWQSDSAGDISPLVAVTVARHLAVTQPAYDVLDSVW